MLADRIHEDYKQAMKNKDALRVSTLSFLRSQIKYALIEAKQEKIDDPAVITVIKKQVKQRQDSIAQYEGANRYDLADKEKAELAILKEYLPPEMTEEQLLSIIRDTVAETGAKGVGGMGVVMKAVQVKVEGQADNKLVSTLVRKTLQEL
jgi:uncharacterized protein YqeY